MSTNKLELGTPLKAVRHRGYQPMGILFYDAKTKLLGIAPLASVPDAWTEAIGRRLGNVQWTEVKPQ